MADEKLIGPQPIIGAGDSPDTVGGNAPTTEYAPINEAANLAIYGYNPATGKAFTPTESAAVNGGWNPWAGAIGYQVDPRTGNLNVLKSDGSVMTTGATYKTTSAGGIVPNTDSNWTAFRYDDLGRPINAQGQPITDEDIRQYNTLVAVDPEKAKEFAQGKGIAVADGQPLVGSGVKQGSTSSAFTTGTSGNGLKTEAQIAADTASAKAQGERQSAYDLLYSEFQKYGLESLVTPLKGLITSGASPSEFTIKLRETPAYQQRFAGNAQRVANGLAAIDEATYIAKEDAYQNLMRNYGLPDTYWKKGPMGTQEGFTKLIANDVSAVELENRLQTAQQRVVNANPEVAYTLKAFYPDITNGDILAYALDPKNALDAINRKVTAAEIGGAALAQGLSTTLGGAEGLAAYGITKNQAEQGYQTVAGLLPRATQLADIYGQQPYNQATAEAEVFGTQGAAEAKRRREKLVSLETAKFGGSSGVGALGRDKAIYGATQGQTGQF